MNPYPSDSIFGPLWQNFAAIPGLEWQASGIHEKDHKVWVTYRGKVKAIGFAHELASLPKEKLKALVEIYFDEEKKRKSNE